MSMNKFSESLRRLADAIEGHQIAKGELVAAGIDSGGEPYLQLDPQPFDRVVGEHEWAEDSVAPEHVRAMIDGVRVSTVLDRGQRFRRNSIPQVKSIEAYIRKHAPNASTVERLEIQQDLLLLYAAIRDGESRGDYDLARCAGELAPAMGERT